MKHRKLAAKLSNLGICATMAFAGTAVAHHSAAMFDGKNLVTIEGTVKQWDWINPHAWLHVMVNGKEANLPIDWSVELGSPNNLYREGLRPGSLKPGDKVRVTLAPLKDGSPGGQIRSMIMPDGKEFTPGGL